jgi:hypothetical protein
VRPACPWCASSSGAAFGPSAAGDAMVMHAGQSHILITDEQGQHIGYLDGQFVNTISNAYASPVLGGLGVESEPVYTLPVETTATISVDGDPLSNLETTTTIYIGPGFAVGTDDAAVQPNSSNEITIDITGPEITYNSSNQHTTTIVLGQSSSTQGQAFHVGSLDVGPSDTVSASMNQASHELVLNNDQGPEQQYSLTVTLSDAGGVDTFINPSLPLSSGDTNHIDYGSFDGLMMPIGVDVDSNGSIDRTVLARNYGRLYVPYARGR